MPYLSILFIALFAAFFYAAAEIERKPPLLWCGPSVLISVVMLFYLHWSWLGILLGQIGLFVGITLFRIGRKS